MAGGGEAGGWQCQLTNYQATVSGHPTFDSDRVARPLSDPSRDPSRDHEIRVARNEARHENCHEAGEHESVHVFMSRVPSMSNENTDEPQVDPTRGEPTTTAELFFHPPHQKKNPQRDRGYAR